MSRIMIRLKTAERSETKLDVRLFVSSGWSLTSYNGSIQERETWLRERKFHVTFGWRRDVNALSCFSHMPCCMSTNGSRGHIKCLNKWLMIGSWCGSDQLDGGQRKPSHEPSSTRKHTITACEWNLRFIYTCRRSCESETQRPAD